MAYNSVIFIHTVKDVCRFIENEVLSAQDAVSYKIRHILHEEYLQRLIAGESEDNVYVDFKSQVKNLQDDNNIVIVTCSSLGEMVKRYRQDGGSMLFRIDEPMLECAATMQGKIALVVTNDTTVKPSLDVFNYKRGCNGDQPFNVDVINLKQAVTELLSVSGDIRVEEIKNDIIRQLTPYDVIVVAQVSTGSILSRFDINFPAVVLKSYETGIKPVFNIYDSAEAA